MLICFSTCKLRSKIFSKQIKYPKNKKIKRKIFKNVPRLGQ